MHRFVFVPVVPAMCLLAATLAVAQETSPSEQRDVAGEWVLDAEASDDVPLLPGEAMALARASGAIRAGGRSRGAGPGPDYHRIMKVRAALRGSLERSRRLTILDTGGKLVLSDSGGSALSVTLDGRTVRLEQEGIGMEVTASWEPPLLTIERRFDDGTVVRDEYATFARPRQLVDTTTIYNRRTQEPPVTMRRLYDPVKP